ncbi:Hypothetical predicted protein [Paramuricea clavata]|uniref:Uncharacterized protein n=1 Tax=Paramuricea clavata TaxID=317549 RepID=A0A7D9D915_PARCT|nr:Hypothetical predicted protein [Paramuricea clavata]
MDGENEMFMDGKNDGEYGAEISLICSHTKESYSKDTTGSQNTDTAQHELSLDGQNTVEGTEEKEIGTRKRTMTDKGKQCELDKLKEARISALRQVTREINKLKPLLQDFNNFEFVSNEIEYLNGLVSKLHDAHDAYLNHLGDTDETRVAVEWFEIRDGDIFRFKRFLCEYMSQAKCLKHELNSTTTKGSSRSSKGSKCSKNSSSSTVSYKITVN